MVDFSQFTDEELQQMAANGNADAEEHLVHRYSRVVRVCARPLFLVGGDSEDLMQEGMLGLLSAIREFDSEREASFRTFAELCIRRRIISAIKSASRMKHSPLNEGISLEDAFQESAQSSTVHSSPDFRRMTEEQVLAKESTDEFFKTYSRSLSKLEQIVLSYFLDGLSYSVIAQRCGKDVKAVDNAVQRIRRKLASNLFSGDCSES